MRFRSLRGRRTRRGAAFGTAALFNSFFATWRLVWLRPQNIIDCFAEGRIGTAGVSARFRPGFSHSFCLRDVAWIHPAYALTKRGDVGATDPTRLARQWRLTKQSRHRFASLLHHPLIIAHAWKGCSWATLRKRIRRIDGSRTLLYRRNILGFHEVSRKSGR